jgi:pyruvate,water dikinase
MDALAAELEPGVTYAVRSSAHGEDQADASFAGQFDSVLGCRSVEAVARAVCTVWASLFGERAVSYSLYRERHPQGMAVIIQRQVEAVVSGVMFTRDPRNAAGEELLVEYCAGLGERLVSGQVSPGRLRIHRQDRSFVEEAVLDDPVAWNPASAEAQATLCQLALKLEKIFQCPQDVEWSVDQVGQLYVLQARPITASAGSPDDVVWTNANIAENFPEPICPLLRSFVGQGYAAYFRGLGVAFGISERRLAAMGQALDNLVGCHGGRLYYNLSNIHTVLHLAPGGPLLARYFNQFTGAQEFPTPKRNPRSRMAQVPEILWVSVRVAWCYLHVQRGLRAFEQRVDAFASTSEPNALAALSLQQLVDLMRAFLEIRLERWTGAALADTAAMVCYGVLTALLRGQAGVDANDLLKGLPGLASAEPVERLWDLSREVRRDNALSALISESSAETVLERLHEGQHPTFHNALSTYIDTWGFRSSGELMLSRPTPQEDPLPVLRLLKSYVAMGGEGPAEVSWRQAAARASATRQARRRLGPWRGAIFGLILRATQGSILLRERARMKQALLYTRLRHVALSLGQLLVAKGLLSQPDDVLYLSMEEAISLAEGTETRTGGACQRVRDRRAEISACRTWSPPDSFALPEGETWSAGIATESQEAATSTEMLTGVAACGGRARGHAVVVLNVTEIDRICEDQILVTRQTDPGWASVFFMVQGLVIERGGMLSHGAIIAREYGIPTVIGVRDATRLIGDGDFLFVDGDKGCVQFVCD